MVPVPHAYPLPPLSAARASQSCFSPTTPLHFPTECSSLEAFYGVEGCSSLLTLEARSCTLLNALPSFTGCVSLTTLDVSDAPSLLSVPDLSDCAVLEKVFLQGCTQIKRGQYSRALGRREPKSGILRATGTRSGVLVVWPSHLCAHAWLWPRWCRLYQSWWPLFLRGRCGAGESERESFI